MLTVKSDQSERIPEAGITEKAVKEMIKGSASFLSPVSSRFNFEFALPQFREPDYLVAWNRLRIKGFYYSQQVRLSRPSCYFIIDYGM